MHKPFLPVLHAMRGIAAVLVVVFHAWHMGLSEVIHSPLIAKGYLWVDFFFLLSGFIIAYHYEMLFSLPPERKRLGAFYAIRAARIFPMHWLVLLIWAAIELLQLHIEGHGFDKERVWPNLLPDALLMQSWLFQDTSWNPPSWSISCEWLFYLAFPFLAHKLARRSPTISTALIALMFGALFCTAHFISPDMRLSATSNGGLFRAIPEFVIGILIFNIATLKRDWLRAHGTKLFFFFALFTLHSLIYPISDFVVAIGFAGMVLGGAGIEGSTPRAAKFLGDISYSVYILHSVLIAVVAHFLPVKSLAPLPALLLGVGLVAFVLCCSALTHRFIERPCQMWAKRRFGPVLPH